MTRLVITAAATVQMIVCMVTGFYGAAYGWDWMRQWDFPITRALVYGYVLVFLSVWMSIALLAWWTR